MKKKHDQKIKKRSQNELAIFSSAQAIANDKN